MYEKSLTRSNNSFAKTLQTKIKKVSKNGNKKIYSHLSEFSSFNKKQQGLYQNALFYICTASKFWKNWFDSFVFGGQI